MCCFNVCGCVFACDLIQVVTGPGSGTCCPLACLCCSRWVDWVGASAGGFGGARAPGARVRCTAHVWVAGAWRGRWAIAPGSRGAFATCLWGLFPGASTAVFWVDAWLSLRWASWVLCSVGAAGGLGLVAWVFWPWV